MSTISLSRTSSRPLAGRNSSRSGVCGSNTHLTSPIVLHTPPSPSPSSQRTPSLLPQLQLPTPPLSSDSSVFASAFSKPMPAPPRRSTGRAPKPNPVPSNHGQDPDFEPHEVRPTKKSTRPVSATDSDDEFYIPQPTGKTRKRKRSLSPPLSDSEGLECISDFDAADNQDTHLSSSRTIQDANEVVVKLSIKDLTIRVPQNHVGPIVLQLDATHAVQLASKVGLPPTPTSLTTLKRARLDRPASQAAVKHPESTKKHAGFLDLPAELRNEVYRLVFASEGRFNFATPKHFSRSTALLRTCRAVHQEACSILYGENEFYFARRTSRYGSFWEDEWREVGFRSIRKFLKSIGPKNTSLIKYISFQFEDATPCLNPESMTHDERRFVNDDHLMSVLRHLGEYSNLRQFDMNFHGRRRVEHSDQRFLECLRHIKADIVRFVPYPIGLQTAFAMESKQEECVRQALLKSMTRTRTPRS